MVESFSPDFYLPDFDLYLELTTLRQTLVRKKNRKLRRLRELYPDVRIKLFYARDFRALMLKYGKLGAGRRAVRARRARSPPPTRLADDADRQRRPTLDAERRAGCDPAGPTRSPTDRGVAGVVTPRRRRRAPPPGASAGAGRRPTTAGV